MKSVIYVAVGTVLVAYGFSYGLSLPYYVGHITGWVGVVVSIGAAYLQYRESLPHEHFFSQSDWQETQHGLSLLIPLRLHKKGVGATVVILEKSVTGYEHVLCGNHVHDDGSVAVYATKRFDGKIIIK